jgi:hypothetical protein
MEWHHLAAVAFVVIVFFGMTRLLGRVTRTARSDAGFTHRDGRYMIRIHDGRWRVFLDGVPLKEGPGEDKAAAIEFLETHKRWMAQ